MMQTSIRAVRPEPEHGELNKTAVSHSADVDPIPPRYEGRNAHTGLVSRGDDVYGLDWGLPVNQRTNR